MDEKLVEKVAEAALEGLHDRKGLGDILDSLKYDDPEIYGEILKEVGEAAIQATGVMEMREALGQAAEIIERFVPDDALGCSDEGQPYKPAYVDSFRKAMHD